MEMCYDGALVMPKNYVAVTEEEMTYVDGGTLTNLKKNIVGLWQRSAGARATLKSNGITLGSLGSLGYCSYWWVVAKVGSAAVVGGALGIAAFGSVVAAGIYLYNKRVFY